MEMNRRNLLRALGLAGPAYFAPSLGPRKAHAAAAPIPTRILFFYTPHGTMFRQWIKTPAGAAAATETNFDLGPILEPLSAFKSKMIVLQNLGMASLKGDPIAAADGHTNAQTHALSATNRANTMSAGGISIDQFIGQSINMPSPVTALPSLELSARSNAGIAEFRTSWSGSNALVPPMTDPGAVYTRLFPNGPPSSQAQTAAAALAARRKSVLDAVLGEFNGVKSKLSATDKAKLDSHAALIRNLEIQLGLSPNATGECTAPTQATIAKPYATDCPKGTGNNCITDATTAFTDLVVSAFSCDITRVVTMDITQLPTATLAGDDLHAFLHSIDDTHWALYGDKALNLPEHAVAEDPVNVATGISFYAQYSKILANLLAKLDAIKEPDGQTLLDHTVVIWCGEIGGSNHTENAMNYLLVGGAGGYFKTGRYLGYKVPANGYGPPHNNLFVSLANAMGLSNVTTFGNPSVCTGPMTQLRG
jgi:hypothetical protein